MTRASLPLLGVALAAATAALLASCDRYPNASDADVLSIQVVCPAGGTSCPPIANGAAVVGVQACTKASDRIDNLKVTLRISPLEWQNPPDPTQRSVFTASLSDNPCVVASFVTRTSPDLVRVDAEMAGFRPDPLWIQTQPASPTDIELIPQPAFLTTNTTTTIKLAALVFTSSGKPTAGTLVQFDAATITPPSGSAYIWPGSAVLDLTKNPPEADATIVTGPSVKSVDVRITAIPPSVAGAPDGGTFVRDFTLAGNH